jgi:hypothetical protein
MLQAHSTPHSQHTFNTLQHTHTNSLLSFLPCYADIHTLQLSTHSLDLHSKYTYYMQEFQHTFHTQPTMHTLSFAPKHIYSSLLGQRLILN